MSSYALLTLDQNNYTKKLARIAKFNLDRSTLSSVGLMTKISKLERSR